MRKTISFLLALAFIISIFSSAGAAQSTSGQITSATTGWVVDVFDADAIAVRLYSAQIAYVRLLGVNSATREGGMDYMLDTALGRAVTLVPDYSGTVTGMDGRWNLMYVYLADGASSSSTREFLNLSLLKFGYADVDSKYPGITFYSTFSSEQKNAKSHKLGMWGDGLTSYYASSDRVNVNTASSKDLNTYMTGLSTSSVIQNILNYRSYAPFRTVDELKFVDGMTREIFNTNRNIFTVITNINTATEKELKTLNYSYSEDIEKILRYRGSQRFTSLIDLYQKADIYKDFYDANRYYMCVSDEDAQIVHAKPDKVVNINTATERQLSDISDVGSTTAYRIVSARRNGYTLKTLMELKEIAGINDAAVHRLSDNCHLYTDMNTASVNEMESLYGDAYNSNEINKIIGLRKMSEISRLKTVLNDDRYTRIEKHIFAGQLTLPDRVNLNTANESQLREVGISMDDARKIYSKTRSMRTPSQIPVDVSAYDKSVALYTNINTASARELRSLNAFSESTVNAIISARNEQPFGSNEEMEKYFQEQRLHDAYKSVSDFIVVR